MNQHSVVPETGRDAVLAQLRQDLVLRLDDLRGFGILSAPADSSALEGEPALMELALSLVDALESTQRKVIETSIQILSLRELVAKLLTRRTPDEVAETVAVYLQKAFDHQRVLVGIQHPPGGPVRGWVAVQDGAEECRAFRLETVPEGRMAALLESGEPVHSDGDTGALPFLDTGAVPGELAPFAREALGPYIAFPLQGAAGKNRKPVGVLLVGRDTGGDPLGEMETTILESVAEAVGTALENVILEEDIRREEAFRKDIMRSMSSGLIAVDLEGRVLTMNAGASRLIQYTLPELRGKTLDVISAGSSGVGDLLKKTMSSRRGIFQVERAVRRADGGAFPAGCTTTLLRNPAGDVYGAVVTFNDLTEIKEMQGRIRSLDRLAALGRFTAGIAHEIRNPLTGIGTGVQYLERHLASDAAQTQNLQFIRDEISRLNRIVEDLFRVTHPHPLQKIPEDPRKVVARAIQSLGDLPESRNVRIETEFPEDPPAVPVDPDQIHQVLLNLFKNALEASPPGSTVRILGYPAPDEARPQFVLQTVDTGEGIDRDALPKIFEPFFTKGKPNGTGLGLYVSHGIVERHGGELHAANTNEGGAIFTLKLPLLNYDMTEML